MLRRTVLSASVFALLLGSSSFALAQKPPGKATKIEATIDQVLPGQGILATSKDGKGTKYAIGFGPASKIGLSGNASVDFIEPGSFVQMDVEMDGEMKPMKDVMAVTVTTASKLNEPVIAAKKGPDQVAGEPGTYIVRGTVRTNKDGMLTVSVGAKQVTVKVALAATVPISIANWQMAKPNDVITGAGIVVTAAAGGKPNMVYCDQMEIKAAMPITKPTKK
jgi:hypothetical protein